MVRAIITWSLHNRLIVLLGTLLLIVVGLYSRVQPERRGLSRPDSSPGRGDHAEPRRQPRGDGAADRHPDRDRLERHARTRIDLRSTSIAGLNDIKC